MASFLSPNYVPEFSPAISTIPIDLYGKVIMQKQAEYNQGVQRTQAYIQNVTGLEMGREQDQQYYNQKVGEYKQKIQGLLTSDFSAPNVVMETSSISSQLYNDKRIRNSVLSRLYEKDYYQQVEKAQQDGTYAPENAFQGLQAINSWKTGDENATLGKMSYTPFDNYTPRLQAYMKSLNPDVRIDQYSSLDANGNRIPYVLQEGKVVAVDDAKVMAAYNSFFQTDASARNQRGLTTSYYSRNISDEQARDALKSTNDQALKSIDEDIRFRENLLVTQSNDPQRVEQVKREIEQLKNNRVRREQNYQQDLADFATNPLQVKANLYDMEQRRQVANVFGYREQSSKTVSNPEWDASFKVAEFDQKQKNWQAEYDLSVAKEAREASVAQANLASQTNGMMGGLYPETLILADDTNSKPEEVDKRVNADLKEVGQEMLKFIYDAATYDDNGTMKSANSNLIVKTGNVYSLAPNVTAAQASNKLQAMKNDYDNNLINSNKRITDIYDDYFGGYNDEKGYNRMLRVEDISNQWDAAKAKAGYDSSKPQRGVDPNYVNVGVGGSRPLTANSNLLGRWFNRDSNTPEGTVVSENFTKWTGDKNVQEFAKQLTQDYAAPSIAVSKAKDEKETFDRYVNTSVRIAENVFSRDSSKQDAYKKALKDAVGFNVAYDKYNNNYKLYVQTLADKVEPLPITYNQAVSLTSAEQINAITNPTDKYSGLRRKQMVSGGVTDMMPISPKNGDYKFQWKSEVRNGVQYPVFQYRPKNGDETKWITLENYFQGLYDFSQIDERVKYLKYAASAEEINEIIRRR